VGDVLREGGPTPHFQPFVDLEGGHAVGYEALIRGPRGSTLERPDALFRAALATFQYARHHTPPVQHTYGTLGRRMAFVGVLGAGLPAFPTPGYAAATSPTATRCCRSGTWP